MQEPGKRALHPGYRADPDRGLDATGRPVVFGTIVRGERVGAADVLNTRSSAMEEYITARAEAAVYKTVKREPLGHSYVPGELQLPDRTMRPDFRFGAASADYVSAKDAIFPPPATGGGDVLDDESAARLYEKSHRSYAPGVQRKHGVVWTAARIDPATHRFGRAHAQLERNAVAKALNPQEDEEARRPGGAAGTQLVPKVVDDFRAATGDRLGHTRGRELTDTRQHPQSYGRARRDDGDWTAADCLRGDFTAEEQAADRDLGRAVGAGYRNVGAWRLCLVICAACAHGCGQGSLVPQADALSHLLVGCNHRVCYLRTLTHMQE